MGHSSSGCKADGDKEKPSTPGRHKRRIWWLKHSPFGPEPKHDKRLSWLTRDKEDMKLNLATRKWDSDEKYQLAESKKEVISLNDIGFYSSSPTPATKHYSHSEKHLSAPLSARPIIIPLEDVLESHGSPSLPVSWKGVKALEDPDSKQDTCSDGGLSIELSKSGRRSHSATFFEGTRFSTIRRSARNFVTDLDEFRREMSNPQVAKNSSELIPPTLFEFRTSVLNVLPNSWQMKPADFLESFLPILEKEPECFKLLLTLDFDVFHVSSLPKPFDAMPLVTTTIAVLTRLGTLARLRISWLPIVKFLINVEEGYNNLPYHSKWHAADVVGNLGYFLYRGWFRRVLSPVHQLTSLLAAAAHDVDHNGQTNQFHRLAKTPIGLSYPESNLEYHHIAKAMGIRNIPGCDWPAEISSKDSMLSSEEIWTLFSTLILRTDPAMHDPEQKPFTNLAKGSKEEQNLAQPPALMEILHFADISNSVKPTRIAIKWAKRFYREFASLGVESRKLNLDIAVFKDAEKMPTLPDTQIFFISKVCLPSFTDLCVFAPETLETVKNLEINLAYWKAQKDKLIQPQVDTSGGPPSSILPENIGGRELVLPASREPSSDFSKNGSGADVSKKSPHLQYNSSETLLENCQLPSTGIEKIMIGFNEQKEEPNGRELKNEKKSAFYVFNSSGTAHTSTEKKPMKQSEFGNAKEQKPN